MSKKGLLWPTLMAVCAFAVLIGLGTWQLQRLHWKEGLQARIEAVRAEMGKVEEAARQALEEAEQEAARVAAAEDFAGARETLEAVARSLPAGLQRA